MDFTFQIQPIREWLPINQSEIEFRPTNERPRNSWFLISNSFTGHVEELQVMDFEFQNRPIRDEHLLGFNQSEKEISNQWKSIIFASRLTPYNFLMIFIHWRIAGDLFRSQIFVRKKLATVLFNEHTTHFHSQLNRKNRNVLRNRSISLYFRRRKRDILPPVLQNWVIWLRTLHIRWLKI